MEIKDINGTTELLISEDSGLAMIPLEDYEELITARVLVDIMRRLWDETTLDGGEFEDIFELVFGQRYEDDED